MDFLHLADIHFSNTLPYSKIDPEKDLNRRFLDQLDCFEYACNYADKNLSEPLIVIAGDVFHYYNPTSKERTIVANLFKKWVDQGINFIIMDGNHDVGNFGWSALGVFKELNIAGIRVVSGKPEVHQRMLFFPFKPGQTLEDVVQAQKEAAARVLIFHCEVLGADYGFGFKSQTGFSVESLFALDFEYIALGHFHQFHRWDKDGRIICYPGSMIPRDFKEFNSQTKYFMHCRLTTKIQVKKIEFPKMNRLVKAELNSTGKVSKVFCDKEEYKYNECPPEYLKGSIVKVIYGKDANFDSKSFDFYSIKNDFLEQGANQVLFESKEVAETDFVELDSIQDLSIIETIKEYCKAKDFDVEKTLEMYEEANASKTV